MKSFEFIYRDNASQCEHDKEREGTFKISDDFLDLAEQYREEGYKIYCQNETWVFKNITCTKVWKDIDSDAKANVYQIPAGKENCSM